MGSIHPITEALKEFQGPLNIGETDCLIMALRCSAANGSADLTAQVPICKTVQDIVQELKVRNLPDLPAFMDTLAERIPAAFARQGDVVFQQSTALGAFGVVVGTKAIFLKNPQGTVALPYLSCIAWRLPCKP